MIQQSAYYILYWNKNDDFYLGQAVGDLGTVRIWCATGVTSSALITICAWEPEFDSMIWYRPEPPVNTKRTAEEDAQWRLREWINRADKSYKSPQFAPLPLTAKELTHNIQQDILEQYRSMVVGIDFSKLPPLAITQGVTFQQIRYKLSQVLGSYGGIVTPKELDELAKNLADQIPAGTKYDITFDPVNNRFNIALQQVFNPGMDVTFNF